MKSTAPPDSNTRKPKFVPPPLACDAHCHIFGPGAKFPYAKDAPYVESDPPRRLVYGWKPLYKDLPQERPSRVTFVLEPFKGQTRLTVTHDEFDDGSKMFAMISKGWPAVLSSLKSFLEMGRGLEPSWGEEERKRAGEA